MLKFVQLIAEHEEFQRKDNKKHIKLKAP